MDILTYRQTGPRGPSWWKDENFDKKQIHEKQRRKAKEKVISKHIAKRSVDEENNFLCGKLWLFFTTYKRQHIRTKDH